jgi:tripartite-type tricarboxylate transporter receptor subunit TctC
MQRLFFLPPGTPKDRVRLLRRSFLDTLKDPEYIAEASKTSLTIGPVTGEEIEEIVSGLFKLDSAMVAKLKNVLVP